MNYKKIISLLSMVTVLASLLVALPVMAQARTVTLTPAQGKVGDTIAIAGKDFTKSTDTEAKSVDIFFSGDTIPASGDSFIDNQVTHYKVIGDGVPVDANGNITRSFEVPAKLDQGKGETVNVQPGTYYVYITREYTSEGRATIVGATAQFTVTGETPAPSPTPQPKPSPAPAPVGPDLTLDKTSGKTGTALLLNGKGFKANTQVTLKYDDTNLATFASSDVGAFVVRFSVPQSKIGSHKITANDGTNTKEITFTVEGTLPGAPAPFLPQTGLKVKAPIKFDWADVTAENKPVTYTLQVAGNKDFPAGSILLEKKDLPTSEYTVTEAEARTLTGRDEPYYWRARVVDAAKNEGAWSGAGTFFVSKGFSFDLGGIGDGGVLVWVTIALGGALLFILGYWLGKRSSYTP